ncbi:unnamed protein product [Ectocarpus fasciculatus]
MLFGHLRHWGVVLFVFYGCFSDAQIKIASSRSPQKPGAPLKRASHHQVPSFPQQQRVTVLSQLAQYPERPFEPCTKSLFSHRCIFQFHDRPCPDFGVVYGRVMSSVIRLKLVVNTPRG